MNELVLMVLILQTLVVVALVVWVARLRLRLLHVQWRLRDLEDARARRSS